MVVESSSQLEKLRTTGKIVREALDRMAAAAEPGVTTDELDDIASAVLASRDARSAATSEYHFPASSCLSVNDEIAHGVPGRRTLKSGDLLKLDVAVEKDGFVADAAITIGVGTMSKRAQRLIRCAESAFEQGCAVAQAGNDTCTIGSAIAREVRRHGCVVITQLCGHGTGRTLHEEPIVPNYANWRLCSPLTEGLVITIEPVVATGRTAVKLLRKEYMFQTSDGRLSAHFEQTILVTKSAPIVITAR